MSSLGHNEFTVVLEPKSFIFTIMRKFTGLRVKPDSVNYKIWSSTIYPRRRSLNILWPMIIFWIYQQRQFFLFLWIPHLYLIHFMKSNSGKTSVRWELARKGPQASGFRNAFALQWRHNERDRLSNHQPHDRLPNRLFGRRSKKTSKLRVTGLYEGNSAVTGEFPAQRASNAKNVSIWWRHHGLPLQHCVSNSRFFNFLTRWWKIAVISYHI